MWQNRKAAKESNKKRSTNFPRVKTTLKMRVKTFRVKNNLKIRVKTTLKNRVKTFRVKNNLKIRVKTFRIKTTLKILWKPPLLVLLHHYWKFPLNLCRKISLNLCYHGLKILLHLWLWIFLFALILPRTKSVFLSSKKFRSEQCLKSSDLQEQALLFVVPTKPSKKPFNR